MEKKIWRDLLTNNLEEAIVCICGIGYDKAASCGKGASLAPMIIRELSQYLPPYSYTGKAINSKVFDFGDVEYEPNKDNKKITDVINTNKFALFLGGDHSISIATQKEFIKKNKGKKVGVIHLDAHLDLCDIYDDNKYSHACVNRRSLDHGLHAHDLTLIGIRSWEKQEEDFINDNKDVLVYPMYLIKKQGLDKVIKEVIQKYENYDALYLSLDIDILDPAYAPGTGTPEAGGLTSIEVLELVMQLITNLNIKAMDVVEVAPPLDVNNITSWVALKVIYEVFYQIGNR